MQQQNTVETLGMNESSSGAAQCLGALQGAIHAMLQAQSAGASGQRLAHLQGVVDGMIQAASRMGVATSRQLLELVTAERARFRGPAVRLWNEDALQHSEAGHGGAVAGAVIEA